MTLIHAFVNRTDGPERVFRWDSARDKFGYVPSRNLDANHCEFFIDGTFGQTFSHAGASKNTLEFYFHVDLESLVGEQHGQVLNLAACIIEPEDTYIVTAKDNSLPICLAVTVPGSGPSGFSGKLTGEFAFFLDVKRADGSVDRLWLKNGDRNFRIDDIAKYTIAGTGFGTGHEYYIAEDSPLFNQKKACRR